MAKETIKLKKYFDVVEELAATAVAVTPGYLLELTSTGAVQAHSTAGGVVLPMFALEDEMQGGDIDTDYAVSAKIQVWVTGRGEIVNALLADGETVVIGDFLESAGDGTLQKYDDDSAGASEYPNSIVGVAVNAVDMSGSSGADPDGRIQVRIN